MFQTGHEHATGATSTTTGIPGVRTFFIGVFGKDRGFHFFGQLNIMFYNNILYIHIHIHIHMCLA